jgi:hypothetical protein
MPGVYLVQHCEMLTYPFLLKIKRRACVSHLESSENIKLGILLPRSLSEPAACLTQNIMRKLHPVKRVNGVEESSKSAAPYTFNRD